MSGKDGVGQIIKAFVTVVTLIALTGRLRVIKAALDDLVGLTRWAGDTIWPAQLTDGLITLDIIDEILDIDLHGGLLSEIVEWDGVSIHHPQIHDPGIQYERHEFRTKNNALIPWGFPCAKDRRILWTGCTALRESPQTARASRRRSRR